MTNGAEQESERPDFGVVAAGLTAFATTMLLAATQVWGFTLPRSAFLGAAIATFLASFGIAGVIVIFEIVRKALLPKAKWLRAGELACVSLVVMWAILGTSVSLLPLMSCVASNPACTAP